MGALDHLAGFSKEAVMKLRDVERSLLPGGHRAYLRDEGQQELAQKLIEEENAKRVGLRHPWLTGIPTLGIWPGISQTKAEGNIKEELFRKYPDLSKNWNRVAEQIRQEDIENERLQIERDKANQLRNAVLSAGLAGSSIMSVYNRGRNMDKESQVKTGALDHLAGFAKEAEAAFVFMLDSAIEGLKKEAEIQGITVTDEQVLEILKEAGFWSKALKPRKLLWQNKLLSKLPLSTRTKLLKAKHLPLVPYKGGIVGEALIGAEKAKAAVDAGSAMGGRVAKEVIGLPKTIAQGAVKIPKVVKKTVQTATKKGPEQKESIKKLLAALGIGGAGVGTYTLLKKDEEEEQAKAAAINPLMAGIPFVTGTKAKDKDKWDLKKSLLLGAAIGALIKIPKFKPLSGAGTEKTIAGLISGGALGGAGHGISSLLRKKEEIE